VFVQTIANPLSQQQTKMCKDKSQETDALWWDHANETMPFVLGDRVEFRLKDGDIEQLAKIERKKYRDKIVLHGCDIVGDHCRCMVEIYKAFKFISSQLKQFFWHCVRARLFLIWFYFTLQTGDVNTWLPPYLHF
jgi:hypothetical protein